MHARNKATGKGEQGQEVNVLIYRSLKEIKTNDTVPPGNNERCVDYQGMSERDGDLWQGRSQLFQAAMLHSVMQSGS